MRFLPFYWLRQHLLFYCNSMKCKTFHVSYRCIRIQNSDKIVRNSLKLTEWKKINTFCNNNLMVITIDINNSITVRISTSKTKFSNCFTNKKSQIANISLPTDNIFSKLNCHNCYRSFTIYGWTVNLFDIVLSLGPMRSLYFNYKWYIRTTQYNTNNVLCMQSRIL